MSKINLSRYIRRKQNIEFKAVTVTDSRSKTYQHLHKPPRDISIRYNAQSAFKTRFSHILIAEFITARFHRKQHKKPHMLTLALELSKKKVSGKSVSVQTGLNC